VARAGCCFRDPSTFPPANIIKATIHLDFPIATRDKQKKMESDERPAKIRKLSSHHERDTLPAQSPSAANKDEDAHMQDAAGTASTQPPTTQPLADAPESTISNLQNPSAGTTTDPSLVNTATAPHQEPLQQPTPASTTTSTEDGTAAPPPLSKSMQKKLRKQAEWDAKKEDRKVWRKEKNQAKKERKREEKRTNPDAWKEKQKAWIKPTMLPITLLIDCDFDNLMRDNERISLGGQLTRCYSDNKNAAFRAHLTICSFNGKLRERFDGVLNKTYTNWKGVRFLDEDFVVASEKAKEWMADDKRGGRLAGVFEKYVPVIEEKQETTTEETKTEDVKTEDAKTEAIKAEDTKQSTTLNPKHRVYTKPTSLPPADLEALHAQAETIYLSADSDYTLTELKPFSTYIIGGLVDKNREKGICAARASAAGIKTARLPIGDYLAMASRKVLTTNHVHEIMLKWLECGDWGEAFMSVIPKRKGGQLKGYAGEGGEEDDAEGDADEENDFVEEGEERDDDVEEEDEIDATQEQSAGAEKTE
jgi:tRNA (guanine9-N1)-methyltransferase